MIVSVAFPSLSSHDAFLPYFEQLCPHRQHVEALAVATVSVQVFYCYPDLRVDRSSQESTHGSCFCQCRFRRIVFPSKTLFLAPWRFPSTHPQARKWKRSRKRVQSIWRVLNHGRVSGCILSLDIAPLDVSIKPEPCLHEPRLHTG